jgi:phage N-6-adenine-methyltransferase
MLGTSLRDHRRKQKLTLEKVANACALSYRVVWKLEHGTGTYKSLSPILHLLDLELAGRKLPPGQHLGEQLKMLRLRQELSLETLSQMATVSKSGLMSLEQHGAKHIAVLEKVASVLGAGLYLKPIREEKSFYTHAGNSSGQNLWQTPRWLISALTEVLEDFDLDPCAPRRRDNYTAKRGFTAEDDGLNRPWFGKVFINPPYSSIAPWISKIAQESASHKVTNLVALVPARTDTNWWHDAMRSGATIMFLKGRLKFGDQEQSAPFPSALLLWKLPHDTLEQLRRAFPTAQLFLNSAAYT